MRLAGGVWCDAGTWKPIGKAACKAFYDGADPTFQEMYQGWENQPDAK